MIQIDEAGPVCLPGASRVAIEAISRNVRAAVPGTTNLGTYVCKTNPSGQTVSLHGVGRAADIGCPSQTGETAQGLATVALLHLYAEALQVQRIIHARIIWDPVRGDHPYTAADPHFNHVHTEINLVGAQLTAAQIDRIFSPIPEDEVTDSDLVKLTAMVRAVVRDELNKEFAAVVNGAVKDDAIVPALANFLRGHSLPTL